MTDAEYMRKALELAKKGAGRVAPNPMVGAVIVKDGRVIGSGWHEIYGSLHAERNALRSCTESPEGASIYVSLEPCCHHGKQPPCTEAIIESGIARVIIGSADPNPQVSGRGVALLRERGIEVVEGVLRAECDELNEVFFHYIRTKTPFVVMKYAMTMDGKIATHTGASKWITGEAARRRVHEDRHRYTAIMAGIGTVLADDPLLNCRIENGRDPIRIICDTHLRLPLTSKIAKTAPEIRTIIASSCEDDVKRAALMSCGCEVLLLPTRDGHLDLSALMTKLGELGIDSILLEGGAALNWSALQSRIVQRAQCYIAPKLFGGAEAKSPVAGQGVDHPGEAFRLFGTSVTRLGEDYLFESEVRYPCSQEL